MMDQLYKAGLLRDLDVQLVKSLLRIYDTQAHPLVQAVLALASRASGDGHVCLDLMQPDWYIFKFLHLANPDAEMGTDRTALQNILPAPPDTIQGLKDCPKLVDTNSGDQPFVLDQRGRLYLRRFWEYEKQVAERLRDMANQTTGRHAADYDAQISAIVPALSARQKDAIHTALERRLAIITGGPGTGKTFVASQLLVLLAQSGAQAHPLRVRMAAPTGKAAVRMDESVNKILDKLKILINKQPAQTLERMMGYRKGSPYFRHNRNSPLPADVVLIDETSMVDLPKMAKLLDGIGSNTQLILLGDKDQLSSVDPGSVMAELCQSAMLAPCVTVLDKNQRAKDAPALIELSQTVNANPPNSDLAWKVASQAKRGISIHSSAKFKAKDPFPDFQKSIQAGYKDFLATDNPKDAFAALAKFRVLCALRRGPQGVEQINRAIEEILKPNRHGEFYDHRVVLVTKNNYEVELFNGDVGVVLHENHRPVVYFESGPSQFRTVPCRLLPEHETAFAMTIHKAQGSGFRRVLVLLPDRDNAILTRELLYTAITRAETEVELWCTEPMFRKCVDTPTLRHMGLKDRLDAP